MNNINEITNKIFKYIFDKDNHLSIEKIKSQFAYDLDLPIEVKDSLTNELTWTNYKSSAKFIKLNNMEKIDISKGWLIPKKEVKSLEEIINIYKTINLITTERVYDSQNVTQSDTIYRCENIYNSTDCSDSKNLLFCESCCTSEYLIASKSSGSSTFSIRIFDSKNCTNSYNVICSNKIINSLFIQDCFNLYECIFCSHISNKKFCIANMQFEEKEYYKIKEKVIEKILNF